MKFPTGVEKGWLNAGRYLTYQSIQTNSGSEKICLSPDKKNEPEIRITKNGPYIVSGSVPLFRQTLVCNFSGDSVGWKEGERYPVQETYALCRCGGSHNKPFCDGTHLNNQFDGTETASRVPYLERAGWTEGPGYPVKRCPGFLFSCPFLCPGKRDLGPCRRVR